MQDLGAMQMAFKVCMKNSLKISLRCLAGNSGFDAGFKIPSDRWKTYDG